MARTFVKRLHDLEIDEISLVNRGANQHATVEIVKRDGETRMPIFDAEGVEVLEDELEHGDVVYDDNGTEFVFIEGDPNNDDTTAALQGGYEDEPEVERELAGVGKSLNVNRGSRALLRAGNIGGRVRDAARANPRELAGVGGGSAVAGFAAGRGSKRNMSKSLGETVLEELSKALTEDDRDQVIAKAMNEVEVTKRENAALRTIVEEIQEERELARYTEIAKGYGLPVADDKLARILKSAVDTMAPEDLDELDRLLSSQGELYAELGSNGSFATSNIMDQVEAMALETVGKAQGVSEEQATVALFDANPDAYDEYLSEQYGR